MKANPVGWFEIYVQDLERAKTFYESVFQTTLDRLPPPAGQEAPENANGGMQMVVFPMTEDTYGAAGALVQMEGVPSGGNSTLVYFSCEDCAVEAARVPDSGGSIFKEKFPIGEYGHIALVFDTEGNMFGLHSMQ